MIQPDTGAFVHANPEAVLRRVFLHGFHNIIFFDKFDSHILRSVLVKIPPTVSPDHGVLSNDTLLVASFTSFLLHSCSLVVAVASPLLCKFPCWCI